MDSAAPARTWSLTTIWRVAGLVMCLVIVAVVGLWASGMASRGESSSAPQAGSVDLGTWNFIRDGSVSLAGHWLYFDRQWMSGKKGGVSAMVPGPWPAREPGSSAIRREGFGTYTLLLRLPAAPAGNSFAVETGQVWSAYRLFADGRTIAASGNPSGTPKGERANSYSTLARSARRARTASGSASSFPTT